MDRPIFLNNQEMVVDSKLRVGIPERFMKVLREAYPDHCDKIGVAASADKSIKLMPEPIFLKELEYWSSLDDRSQNQRTILNISTAFADLLPLDKQNRLKLSPALCKFCNISREVIIVGSVRYMQIFDLDSWNELVRKNFDRFGGASDALASPPGGKTGTAPEGAEPTES